MKHHREILVVDRFPPLRKELLALLGGLSAAEWTRPTAAPKWTVKNVTAYLLGGDNLNGECRPRNRW
jgi:hypothetical protein